MASEQSLWFLLYDVYSVSRGAPTALEWSAATKKLRHAIGGKHHLVDEVIRFLLLLHPITLFFFPLYLNSALLYMH